MESTYKNDYYLKFWGHESLKSSVYFPLSVHLLPASFHPKCSAVSWGWWTPRETVQGMAHAGGLARFTLSPSLGFLIKRAVSITKTSGITPSTQQERNTRVLFLWVCLGFSSHLRFYSQGYSISCLLLSNNLPFDVSCLKQKLYHLPVDRAGPGLAALGSHQTGIEVSANLLFPSGPPGPFQTHLLTEFSSLQPQDGSPQAREAPSLHRQLKAGCFYLETSWTAGTAFPD